MPLDNRKLKILNAIVESYILTGEPVASKRLAQMLDVSVSPATVRNDMAVLFDMGLLEQPHTSAGRVPSHLGYRVYVDRLMRRKPLSVEEKRQIDALFNVRDPDPDKLLEDSAAALADLTGCAAFTLTTTPRHVRVQRVEVVPVNATVVVLLIWATNGVVKTQVCRLDFTINRDIVEFFTKFANDRFSGKTLREISYEYVGAVSISLGEYAKVFTPLLVSIYELCLKIYEGQFFIAGTTNLLAYQEFYGVAHDLLTLISRREEIGGLVASQTMPVQLHIGKENSHFELVNAAVLVEKFKIGPDDCGAIGVVGPVRIDYASLLPHVDYFAQTLGKLLTDTLEQNESPD